jgi:hypothetical protein
LIGLPDRAHQDRGERLDPLSLFSPVVPFAGPALVKAAVGPIAALRGRPFLVMGFTVAGERIVEIDILADPVRLSRLDLALLDI